MSKSIEEFLLQGITEGNETKFVIPRLGDSFPVTLRAITPTELQRSRNAAIKYDKDHKPTGIDEFLAFENMVKIGMVSPRLDNPNIQKAANEKVEEFNKSMEKAAKSEFEVAKKLWEDNGKKGEEPIIRKPAKKKPVTDEISLLEAWFNIGEINAMAEEISKMSGFAVKLKELEEEVKN